MYNVQDSPGLSVKTGKR